VENKIKNSIEKNWDVLSSDWKSYIEFGAQKGDTKERFVGRHISGRDGYDLWHLAVRYKEILTLRQLLKRDTIILKDIPRKNKFLMFFLFFSESNVSSVTELGCSTLELIDGLELVNKYLEKRINLKEIRFIGIDDSNLMRIAASDSHTHYDIEVFNDTSSFLHYINSEKNFSGALFDLNVSSYAFTTSQELSDFLNNFNIGYVELALSMGQTFVSNNYQGTPFTYFSLKEVIEILNKPLYFLYKKEIVTKNWLISSLGKPVINGYFVFGDYETIQKSIKNAKQNEEISAYFKVNNIELIEASMLLKS